MIPSLRTRNLLELGALALLASLAWVSFVGAQPNPARQAAREQVKLNEAELLRHAYVLLASANHDYKGHRLKAMNAIHEAFKTLDRNVMAKGTAAQKAATLVEEDAAARAKIVARYVPTVHEGQAQSDAQLQAASNLLQQVATMTQGRQVNVLRHVEKAASEVSIALKIR